MEVNIIGEHLNHLRCADDIVLISNRTDQVAHMLDNQQQAPKDVG